MGIHLRSVLDEQGDTVDYFWYCSNGCYRESFYHRPVSETVEEGGAYPCGAEHDAPDFCDVCGYPVGNPVTDEGAEYVRDAVAALLLSGHPGNVTRGEELRDKYSYLFDAVTT